MLFSPRFLVSADTKASTPPGRRTRTSKANITYRCDNMVRARNSALPVRMHPSWAFRPETSVSLRRILKIHPPIWKTHGEQYSREGVERADARPLAEIGAHVSCIRAAAAVLQFALRYRSLSLMQSQCGSCWRDDGTTARKRDQRIGQKTQGQVAVYFLFREGQTILVKRKRRSLAT